MYMSCVLCGATGNHGFVCEICKAALSSDSSFVHQGVYFFSIKINFQSLMYMGFRAVSSANGCFSKVYVFMCRFLGGFLEAFFAGGMFT